MDFLSNIGIADIFGYLASVFIVLAFFFSKITTIRIINAIGCICFVIYAAMIKAWPVLIPNALLFLVQAYYIAFKPGK
ncbi:uroporphyrinogen decarboxylase [Empedobacter falsenii]|uniref:uroporphyrinogen decarboxylase n=1 Tax=Empedobacter stercoris TaxID=1628248 RepID=UPI0016627EA9|nr:uroporphyrinogen decarboxylase [Empedobacter stercoris]MCA4809712.1 uroporphyrinogen decarboxylase [Empedobacter stercoris]QNT14742.1 uroporphyrinogen decarboxylase [Empedobacter stercoris]